MIDDGHTNLRRYLLNNTTKTELPWDLLGGLLVHYVMTKRNKYDYFMLICKGGSRVDKVDDPFRGFPPEGIASYCLNFHAHLCISLKEIGPTAC